MRVLLKRGSPFNTFGVLTMRSCQFMVLRYDMKRYKPKEQTFERAECSGTMLALGWRRNHHSSRCYIEHPRISFCKMFDFISRFAFLH